MDDAGSSEAVALRLMETIIRHNPEAHYGREDLLGLYRECLLTVRGPATDDLLAALGLEE